MMAPKVHAYAAGAIYYNINIYTAAYAAADILGRAPGPIMMHPRVRVDVHNVSSYSAHVPAVC